MKICKIRIKDFQQFKDIDLDFTNPSTGEPVDKICFIGNNGTGKTTLINFIWTFLDGLRRINHTESVITGGSFKKFGVKFKQGNQTFYYIQLQEIYCFTENDISGFEHNIDIFGNDFMNRVPSSMALAEQISKIGNAYNFSE